MQAIRRVLVAVKEPAARSQPAAAKAAQLARGLGARLELFHAIDTALYVDLVRMRGATIEARGSSSPSAMPGTTWPRGCCT